MAGATLRVVRVGRGATWTASTPVKLFDGQFYTPSVVNPGRNYDVSPDGRRFLTIKEAAPDQTAAAAGIVVVQNFMEELKRLVPVN